MLELYKIKNPYDEQYSAGLKHGYLNKTKKGKTWNSLGAIKNHLIMVQKFDEKAFDLFYNNWLVLKITENGIEEIGKVKDYK